MQDMKLMFEDKFE